jgi:hypothetical protein
MIFAIKQPITNWEQVLIPVSRISAAFTLAAMFSYIVDIHNQAETLQNIRIEIVVGVEYYSRSPCQNVTTKERVAFLKDGKILVATHKEGQWNFRHDSCLVNQS